MRVSDNFMGLCVCVCLDTGDIVLSKVCDSGFNWLWLL